MDYRTYQQIRTYCCEDLRSYLDLPGYDAMRKLWWKLNGQVGLIQREQQLAVSLHQCSDLTPRERAAAELLAVISNHRAIAWQREPEPPNGNKPAPPLEKGETDALANQTRDAVKRYAAFLPEPQRVMLLADCEAALEAAPDAASAATKESKAGFSSNTERWEAQARTIADECFNRDTANGCRDSLHGYSVRVMGLMQERGVKGQRGIIDCPGTIKREALQSKKWWALKSK